MRPIRSNQWSVWSAALALVIAAWAIPAQAKVRSNTAVRLPDNAQIGDINGDGNQDIVYARGGAVYVTNADYGNHKILYSMLTPNSNIDRLFTGDFQGVHADQICTLHRDKSLNCWVLSADRTTMSLWFTLADFIYPTEEVIVGDFDGDGVDDILVYRPWTGGVRMFTIQGGVFRENPAFSLGNLAGTNLINKSLRAGDFGQGVGQTDLLVYDPTNGQVSRFDAVNHGGASPTFWWAFTTSAYFVSINETLSVANVEGLDRDNLVLRDHATGGYRFFRLEPNATASNLIPINVAAGQLAVVTGWNATDYWLRNRGSLDASSKRDDQMFYQWSNRTWISAHARLNGTTPTYWWNFTGPALKRLDGDANGDQRTDLSVLGGKRWWTIPLATSKGDGTFSETNTANSDPGMYFPSWAAYPGVKLVRGDFDGDGLSDLALVGGKYWGTVPVAFSKGDGSYRVKNEYVADFPAWASRPNVKAVSGDFDGDGKSDIALVGEIGRHSIPVAYSRGDGTFEVTDTTLASFADLAAFRDFTRNPQVWPKVVAEDFNSDGRCDIALAGGTDFTGVPIAFSTGRSTFSFQYQNLVISGAWQAEWFHSRAREPGTQVIAGDFDGNSFPDLALVGGSREETDMIVALNFGDNQFVLNDQSSIHAPLFSQWAEEPGVKVVSGYFNDDVIADIALVGGLGWRSIRGATSDGPLSFRPTDVMGNFGSYAAEPYVRPAANVASNAGRTARSLDQDGDRRGDISLTGGVGWGSMPVASSRGNGDFKVTNKAIDAAWASFAAHSGVSVLAGDFDGDGKEDVALTSASSSMVAFANGDGTFRVTQNGTSVGSPTSARSVSGDFNGDGLSDIIVIGAGGAELDQSYGDGYFLRIGLGSDGKELGGFIGSSQCCAQIVAGDFNGDGASDLAVMGGPANDWVHVYFATRTFGQPGTVFERVSFQNAALHTQITNGARVVAGDFDGDGLDDLFFTRGSGPYMTVGLSQGTGAFVAAPMAIPDFNSWARSYYATPVVGDFNGDGASDIALVGGRGWTTIPVAFSTRRTDLLPWIPENHAVQDFPVYAAQTGALAASSSPTSKVDTVAPPPPTPDPPESMPAHKALYVQGRYIAMPENPNALRIATWRFEFNVCNDNDEDEYLAPEFVIVHEMYWGVGNQWSVNDWWAKGTEVRENGTWANYRNVTFIGAGGGAPPNEDTRPGYKLNSVAAHSCHPMYVQLDGGHPIGFYVFQVYLEDTPPVDEAETGDLAASISLACPDGAAFCQIDRY